MFIFLKGMNKSIVLALEALKLRHCFTTSTSTQPSSHILKLLLNFVSWRHTYRSERTKTTADLSSVLKQKWFHLWSLNQYLQTSPLLTQRDDHAAEIYDELRVSSVCRASMVLHNVCACFSQICQSNLRQYVDLLPAL